MTRLASLTSCAVIVLALALLSSCEPAASSASATGEGSATTAPAAAGLNLVYIRLDSLQVGYTALATELERLEGNASAAQENIQKKVSALEAEVRTLQNKMQQGLLAPNQVQSEQQRIGRKEQEIMQQRDLAMGSIQDDQVRLQNEFGEKVKAILETLREEKGYDMIFNEGGGSGLLMGSPDHDITALVLERLNAMPVEEETVQETEE